MFITSTGDMRQFLLTARNNSELKTDLNRLVNELTSGKVADITSHLGSRQSSLAGFDRTLEMLGRYEQANSETGNMLATMQTVLGGIEARREAASGALMLTNPSSNLPQIENASQIAKSSFIDTIHSLNTRHNDRAVFGGNDVDSNPMAAPEVILDALRATLAGATTEADVKNAITTWFDTPGGGFDMVAYQGDNTGVMSRMVDFNQNVQIDVRADDVAIKDTLKALALGAFAGDQTLAFSNETRRSLQRQAGEDLLGVASSLTHLQAQLGFTEARVEDSAVRVFAQQSAVGIARNELVAADPFDTATRLQSIQIQLETQYTLTARLSRLSLVEYLR